MYKRKDKTLKAEEKKPISKYIILFKALLLALILALILVIAYAILLSFTAMSDTTMSVVTQSITIISIAVSSTYAGRKIGNKGWLYGLLLGLAFIIILAPITMIFGQKIAFDKFLAAKTLMGSTVGLIGGIIGVNLK